MHKATLIALSLALASPMVAQAGPPTLTMPKGFTTTDGAYFSNHIGAYSEGRVQFIYGDWQGSSNVQIFKGIQLRQSSSQPTNTARSWSDVRIRLANNDFRTITDRWAGNMASPTLVFSASVNFPASTTPSATPAPWGKFAKTDDMVFPFGSGGSQASFVHFGQLGTTVDFQMHGGVLANNAAWNTSFKSYYVDGYLANPPLGNVWKEATQALTGNTTCRATGKNRNSTFQSWLFSDNALGGKQHRWEWYGYGMIPNHAHIGVVSVFGQSGVKFQSSCQLLDIDVSKPFELWPYTSDSDGNYVGPFLNFPWSSNAVGAKVYTQAAFDDNGVLQLTAGYNATIPATPPKIYAYMARLWRYDAPTAPTQYGFGPYDWGCPVIGFY